MCEINRNLNFEICIIGIVWQLDWARTRVLHFKHTTKQNKGEMVGERGVRGGEELKGVAEWALPAAALRVTVVAQIQLHSAYNMKLHYCVRGRENKREGEKEGERERGMACVCLCTANENYV